MREQDSIGGILSAAFRAAGLPILAAGLETCTYNAGVDSVEDVVSILTAVQVQMPTIQIHDRVAGTITQRTITIRRAGHYQALTAAADTALGRAVAAIAGGRTDTYQYLHTDRYRTSCAGGIQRMEADTGRIGLTLVSLTPMWVGLMQAAIRHLALGDTWLRQLPAGCVDVCTQRPVDYYGRTEGGARPVGAQAKIYARRVHQTELAA